MTRAQGPISRRIRCRIAIFAAIAALSTTAAVAEPLAEKIILRDKPKPVHAFQFVDGDGKSRGLSDFHGKFVLLNIWATWCVPCRKEMPALDRLEATLGGRDFQVAPLSIDRGGTDVVRKFFAEIGIKNLEMYLDVSGDATRKLNVVGLPTTLIIDREGREIGRLIGPAEWDEPANIEFVKCIIAKDDPAQVQKNSEHIATRSCGGRVVHFPTGPTTKQ
jgi:thiol-disulfide isomerase/thioredoxin